MYRDRGLAGSMSFYVNGELQHTFVPLPYEGREENGWGFGNENLDDYYLRSAFLE